MASLTHDKAESLLLSVLSKPEWQLSLAIGALLFLVASVVSAKESPLYDGFPVIGHDPQDWGYAKAKQRYMASAYDIMQKGLTTITGPFQVITTAGPKIVLPGRYMHEVKNNADLEFPITTHQQFFGDYPGLGLFRETNNGNIVQEATRVKLTQSLAKLTPGLNAEADSAIETVIGSGQGWQSVIVYPAILRIVARTSALTFTGPVLCRNEEWLDLSMNFAVAAFDCARILRLWNPLLRPIVQWILPDLRRMRAMHARASKIINGEVRRRKTSPNDGSEKTENAVVNDAVTWLESVARGRPYNKTDAQLTLTFAAIHTTSDLITKNLFDLAARPEIIEPLREEMIRVLSESGFAKTSFYNMKLLDSFLKESQRLSPSSIAPCSRLAMKEVRLSDNTQIPKGASVTILSDRLRDPSIFPNPDQFDPYRFLKMRDQPGQENSWQFVATSPDHIGFGHGTHACPGRFFASNEAKIILCHVLLKYDVKLVDSTVPANMWVGAELVPPTMSALLFKRRTDLQGVLGL